NLRATGDRIERLLDELRVAADPRSYQIAEELLRAVTGLYGGGLARVVDLVGDGAPDVMARLVDDELVASLLIVHGLHPKHVRGVSGGAPGGAGRSWPSTTATSNCWTSTRTPGPSCSACSGAALGALPPRSPCSTPWNRRSSRRPRRSRRSMSRNPGHPPPACRWRSAASPSTRAAPPRCCRERRLGRAPTPARRTS